VFAGPDLLIGQDASLPTGHVPSEFGVLVEAVVYLGTFEGLPAFAATVAEDVPWPEHLEPTGLRRLYSRVDDEVFALAGRAFQLLQWDRTSRYCGACGTPTVPEPGERARACPGCGLLQFPRLSPVVIVRIERDDRILLAHATGFPGGMHSVLAGFVEPGETLEEAVAREVAEEVAIDVEDIRYFGSQPWPFPHSLMIGFTARHARGEIEVDGREIESAGWYSRDALPTLPMPLSIARRLIDAWLER